MDTTGRHTSVQQVCRWLSYDHLPPHLAAVSKPFADLAQQLLHLLPDDPELVVALRRLVDAKDAAVRVATLLPPAAG